MRTIKNSLGIVYTIALTLSDVRRLQTGVEIEPGRVLVEDFGHSDSAKLQEQADRLLSLPLYAAELMYALLPASLRQQLSFAQFIGDDPSVEPWKPDDLLVATLAVAEEVLDFFQGRLPEAAGLRRVIRIGNKESQAIRLGVEQMTDDQFQLASIAGQLKLDMDKVRPLIKALDEPATMTVEQVSQAIESLWKEQQKNGETTGGMTSTDSLESPSLATSSISPSDSSETVPPEPTNDPPVAPPSSAPSLAS